MTNLDIYEASRSVPEEAQKSFDNGKFKGTDINPMWRIKKLTELFGPCGVGWYYDIISERSETYGETVMAIVDINLYIKVDGEWSKPIYGTGGNTLVKVTRSGATPSDEGYKMALTDALSVACKALGIGADIYFSKDKTKYSASSAEQKPADDPAPVYCEDCMKPIRPVRFEGKDYSVSDIMGKSLKHFKRYLCWECADKAARMAKREADAYASREDGVE